MSEESALSTSAVSRTSSSESRRDGSGNSSRSHDSSSLEIFEELRSEFVDDVVDVDLERRSHHSDLVELLDVSRNDGEE